MKLNKQSEPGSLRRKAEAFLENKADKKTVHLDDIEKAKLIHELEVHQVELEMQNEELLLAKDIAEVATQKYRELYDFAPSGYFTLTATGEITELNLSGATMLGKDRLRLKNSSFGFFLSEDSKPAFNRFLGDIFSAHSRETCELALANSGNLRMYIQLTGILSGNGEHCLVNAMDITARKLLEKNLISSRNLLNDTQKLGKIGGWVLDLRTFTQTWTEQTYHLLEIDITTNPAGAPEGMGFIAPDFRSAAEEAIQRAIQFGEPYDQEWEIITAKGNKRWIHAAAQTNQENGKTVSISGSFQDITERKLAEIALKKRTTELEELNSFFVGRELKMIELKKEINELLKKDGSAEKYSIPS